MVSRAQVSCVSVALVAFAISTTNCREAIRPPADVENVIRETAVTQKIIAESDGSPCSINIQKDLPKPAAPQPLYIVPDTDQFWLPNNEGHLKIPRGASIELYCSKSFANASAEDAPHRIPKNTRTLRPICLQNQTFLLNGEKLEFRHFVCAQSAKYTVTRTSASCADGAAQIYRVGYNITRHRFVETMRVCHDDASLRTHYTQHLLLPANVHFQRFVRRLNFSKAGHFGELNMNFLYSQKNQRQQAEQLLGASHTQYFDNATLFLSRGHLAAKSDMIYATQQRATFNFFNLAPQWQSFNGGQWATLEDEVRKFVAKAQLQVDCYTGTWGTMELPLPGGERRAFYLTHDANNNGLLPVPQLYYRVVVDRRQPRRGIALVGVNDPHANVQQIRERCVICSDVQTEVPWLRWIRNNNLRKGYLYACRVSEFAGAVKHLPSKLREVDEMLLAA